MKNILIIGYGFVGKSVEYSLTFQKDSPFAITIYDPKAGYDVDISEHSDFHAVFICVPTPQAKDGSCNYSVVEHYVEMFDNPTCPIILKSTVVPSAIDKLLAINPELIYVPEFLTEKNWQYDTLSAPHQYIGTNNVELFEIVAGIFADAGLLSIPIRVTPRVASLIKYTANTFLAMKVVYMHEMYQWLKSEGKEDEFEMLTDYLPLDKRLGTSHFKAPGHHGLGYSGTCFPKDTLALVTEAKGNLPLLEEVIKRNASLRRS